MDTASRIFDTNQVISQLRENQIIEYKGKKRNLKDYFNTINKGVEVTLPQTSIVASGDGRNKGYSYRRFLQDRNNI
jgi:hypothetical protein